MTRKHNYILPLITLAAFVMGAALVSGVAGSTTSFAKESSAQEHSRNGVALWSEQGTVDFAVPGIGL